MLEIKITCSNAAIVRRQGEGYCDDRTVRARGKWLQSPKINRYTAVMDTRRRTCVFISYLWIYCVTFVVTGKGSVNVGNSGTANNCLVFAMMICKEKHVFIFFFHAAK